MTFLLLGIILLLSAGLAAAGARGLLALKSASATALSVGILSVYGALLLWQPDPRWVSNGLVLLAGSSLGFLLGRVLRSSGAVLTFLATAAVVDLLSFSDGFTNQIIEAYRSGGSRILRFLAVFVELGGREYAVVGVSDIAILAAAYVGFRSATGSEWKSVGWLLLGLLLAFVAGVAFDGAPAIPFLAATGAAFSLMEYRRGAGISPAREA